MNPIHSDIAALSESGVGLIKQFERTGDPVTITTAIAVLDRAVQLTPEGHADLPSRVSNHGTSFMRRFERTGDPSDIAEAISAQRRAVELTPEGHPNLAIYVNNLAISLIRDFERTGDLSDITEAISAQRRAVELTPEGHPNLATCIDNLASSLIRGFECTGDLSDITEAISAQRRAVELTTEGHADLPRFLHNLGISLTVPCRCLIGTRSTVRRASPIITPTPCSQALVPNVSFGRSGRCHFECTGDLSDIAEAISAQRRAVELTPEGHANLPGCLNSLGNSLQCRFERTGDLSDIAEAISAQHRVVELTPEGHANLPGCLNSLGNSLQCRFERTGDLSDIAEAISAQRRAVELTPEGHAKLPGCLNSLGNSLQCCFERTGDLSDIAEAISAQHRAVQLTREGHAIHALQTYLHSLGTSFMRRFERTKDPSDIAEAISAQRRAVELTPEGHPNLAIYVNNLAISLFRGFECSEDLYDIAEAISAQRRVVELIPEGHPNLATCINNLGTMFMCQFEHTGDISDIAEAISAQRRGVQLIPEGHADLARWLNNLGMSLLCRFKRTADLSDIAEAISAQHKAVQVIPVGHADLPDWLSNLGKSFLARFLHTHSEEDMAASISSYKSAATSTFGPPRQRLKAARIWAKLLNQHQPQSLDILHAFDTALTLIALIAGLDKSVWGRYSQLHDICGIALEAASAACSLGYADKALEWLEQGRCVVWSQLRNLRTPIDDLCLHNQELAQIVADVSKQLETAGSSQGQSHIGLSTSEKISLEDDARAHLKLARQWDDLLKTVRLIPGFESFLQPLSCSSLLQHLPKSGPVVVINVDEKRCDAIALLAGLDKPLHIPLPDFSLKKANKYRHHLKANLKEKQIRMQEVQETTVQEVSVRGARPYQQVLVSQVLCDLWKEVVGPILHTLGFLVMSTDALPRIWWCPTGPLSFLPIHAAGTDSDCVLDYVVSSYIPTVTALTNRVKNHRQIKKGAVGLFLTSQPNSPGTLPIPGTTKEVQSTFRMAAQNGARAAMVRGSTLTVDECLQYMENYSCIHLACHASQNASEPLKSRFLFHNGSLNLATIIQRDLKNADLAFLSACQTSAGDEKLSDEAVHLAAGMLAAGYRRVVATMWSIGDQNAPDVANDFYSHLFSHQEEGSDSSVDGSNSAYALHHAIQKLRRRLDNSENSLLAWAPYVHFGY
ncbi:CHAT domain-containing protein [Coprinopsis sp. MPI-PUGE-AT-0042]|nr:CHAT domain-containing protein [Coprinopsis sp. MPI-PUGE-AT-0042]